MEARVEGPVTRPVRIPGIAGLAVLVTAWFAACGGSAGTPQSRGTLEVVHAEGLTAESVRGESLADVQRGFVLRNVSGAPLAWSAETDRAWLSLPQPAGELSAGGQAFVPVETAPELVAELAAQAHHGRILVRVEGDTAPALVVPFELLLAPRPGVLAVLAAPTFLPSGTEDGTFEPRRETFRFENEGDEPFVWSVETTAEWLDVAGVLSGTLDAAETLELDVRVDEWLAGSQGVGQHTAELRVLDALTGDVAHQQTVVLSVTAGIAMQYGWSYLRGSIGSRIVFVSDTLGNDANDGLSPQNPKKTIAAGKALMRHGEPDYLLLRRGDVFHESLGQWKTSGRSAGEPQVVGAYGPPLARPLLLTGTSNGLITHGGGGSPASIDDVAFVGLHFLADTHTGTGVPIGMALHRPSTNLLIEDCMFERYNTGLVVQALDGRHTNVRLRRSLVLDSFGVADGNPQGLYSSATDGLLIEECVFDTNGWQPTVPGATADIFSHNIYVDTDTSGVVLRGNIIANGASHGAQMRSGGLCHNNLFVRNSIGLMMAGGSGPQLETAHATLNVIVDGKDIDAANPRGWGIDFNDVVGGEMRRNLIANNGGSLPIPVVLDGGGFGGGVHNVTVFNNIIWNWGGSFWFTGESNELTNIDFLDNDLQNGVDASFLVDHFTLSNHASVTSGDNNFYSGLAPASAWMHQAGAPQSVPLWKAAVGDSSSLMARRNFVDPDRMLADYAAEQGFAPTHEAFMQEVRKQSRLTWRRELTAQAVNSWFRSGF